MITSDHKREIVISIDAMGGDLSPHAVINGASSVPENHPDVRFIFHGDEILLSSLINNHSKLKKVSEIIHTDKVISPEERPSNALRKGRDSSMWMAIEAVKEGRADAVVSSGNTGALMAISKILLKTLPDITRPAITGIMPTKIGKSVMLDMGANAECSAENLFQFAIMGEAFAKAVLKTPNPKIGLLNIGSEDVKGNDTVKLAGVMIKESIHNFNFYGFVEGSDILAGTVDVVVTDGFSGNIALKTAEGTASFCKNALKQAFSKNLFAKLGYLLAKSSLKEAFSTLDPRLYNGAMFLGLSGVVVKSHGGADEVAFNNALNVAIELAKYDINKKILSEIASLS